MKVPTRYLYETFRNQANVSDSVNARRRDLMLSLSSRPASVRINELRHLSPALAERYAGKTMKTLFRDVEALEKLGLVESSEQGIRAKREIILQFLPARIDRTADIHG